MPFLWTFATIVYLLPGLAWLLFTRPKNDHWVEKAGIVFGISSAAYVLIFYATYLFQVPLHPLFIWIIWGVLVGIVLWQFARRIIGNRLPGPVGEGSPWRKLVILLLPLIIFIGILVLRFYQVRDLVLPAWVDSLHHVLIVRIFLEQGRVPLDLLPYIDVPFYYHFGFHAVASVVAYLTHLPPEQTVLYIGQVLNALIPIVLFLVARALWRDEKRPLLVLVFVGFVFQMPAYYATWGRYTLLTGVLFLGLAIAAALEIFHSGGSRERVARLAVYTAAILMTHYLAALLLALFYIILAGYILLFGGSQLVQTLKPRRFSALLAAGVGGGLVAAPWIWRVFSYSTAYVKLNLTVTAEAVSAAYSSDYMQYLWFLLGPRRSHILLLVAILSMLLLGWKKQTRPFAFWTIAAASLSLPWGINLAPFRPDHGAILAFFPASLFVADLVARCTEIPKPRWLHRAGIGLALAAVLLLGAWGVKETKDIINPATIIATQADLDAIEWIKENVPAGSKFFINVTPWQYSTYRGVDGGWWISVLTENTTILPAVLYSNGPDNKASYINRTAQTASNIKDCSSELLAFFQQEKLDYVYFGTNRGSLTPEEVRGCSMIYELYRSDQTSVYSINHLP